MSRSILIVVVVVVVIIITLIITLIIPILIVIIIIIVFIVRVREAWLASFFALCMRRRSVLLHALVSGRWLGWVER